VIGLARAPLLDTLSVGPVIDADLAEQPFDQRRLSDARFAGDPHHLPPAGGR